MGTHMALKTSLEKGKHFGIRIIRLSQYLQREHHEYTISRQVLRAGTSIGANLAEAEYAVSAADLLNKKSIALKEAAETAYWLELLVKTDYIEESWYESLQADLNELISMTAAAVKTLRAQHIK